MELLVLNSDFEIISVIDVLDSLIWTDRYSAYGDFEIYTPVTTELLSYLQQEYYLWLNGSDHIMIIEDIQIKCDTEEGNYLIVTGRSLESILDRRIIWEQTILSGNFQNGIETLLNEAIISPTITDRTIENFIFEPSTDTVITDLIIEAQIPRGLNLYEVIQQLCIEKNIGFKVTLSNEDQFIFKLYAGVDRSYEQIFNPYVVFSPNFDNLINADYTESKKTLKTVTVVAGEGEETARKTTVVGSGSSLTRRELYTDANDLSQNDGETVLTDEEYLAQLIQRGTEDLSKNIITKSFESQIDSVINLFKYNEDFFMGDVVQIVSDYGIESRARVTEIIHSQSQEGIEVYPTLTVIDVGEVEADGVLIPGTGSGSGGDTSLSSEQVTDLTDGGDSSLHYHSSDRNRANHSGTQLASTINNFSSSVLTTVLTGLSLVTDTAITAFDTVLSALGKLQKQISDHLSNTSNPHSVTKTQVGLSNVTNDAQIPLTQKGAVNGVAGLDSGGKVPSEQLPDALSLGETSTSAYRGDRGKAAYDHSQIITGNPHGTSKLDVGLGNVTNESKTTMFTNAALTGNPTAPTQASGNNTTRIATTAFVQSALSAGGQGDMLKSVYDINNDGVVDKAASLIFLDGSVTVRGWFTVVSGVLTFNYEEV